MSEKIKDITKTGGRPLELYSELGTYFSPEGLLKEDLFRESLINRFNEIKQSSSGENEFIKSSEQWLNSHLPQITGYLEEKGMPMAALGVLKSTINVCAGMGLKNISIGMGSLSALFSQIKESAPALKGKNSGADKKGVIFEAALKVFSEDGYHGATIDKIASVSGVGKGSVYRYFKSKDELLNELLKAEFDKIIAGISQIISADSDVVMQTEQLIRFWINYIEKNHIVYRLIQSQAIVPKTGDRPMFYNYIISRLPMFKERVVALNDENRLKSLSFFSVFYGIFGFIDGVAQKWFERDMDYPLADEVPVILEVLFNGFSAEGGKRKSFFKSSDKSN